MTSPRYTVSRHELETCWSFEDLCIANDTIDMLDDAEAEASDRARRRAESKSPRR